MGGVVLEAALTARPALADEATDVVVLPLRHPVRPGDPDELPGIVVEVGGDGAVDVLLDNSSSKVTAQRRRRRDIADRVVDADDPPAGIALERPSETWRREAGGHPVGVAVQFDAFPTGQRPAGDRAVGRVRARQRRHRVEVDRRVIRRGNTSEWIRHHRSAVTVEVVRPDVTACGVVTHHRLAADLVDERRQLTGRVVGVTDRPVGTVDHRCDAAAEVVLVPQRNGATIVGFDHPTHRVVDERLRAARRIGRLDDPTHRVVVEPPHRRVDLDRRDVAENVVGVALFAPRW